MRFVFIGSSQFALPTLKQLLNSSHTIAAVLTQPDRPKGRSLKPAPTPVKTAAQTAKLPVFEPDRLEEGKLRSQLSALNAELAVVVAYGQKLPPWLLALFPQKAINLHASLLPKYRGAAPIAWALMKGEKETGITIFQIDAEWDHGPILLQAKIPIHPEDDAETLGISLAKLGASEMLKAVERIAAGKAQWKLQDEAEATHAPCLTKETGTIDWQEHCQTIHNKVRALKPWPGAATFWGGQSLKLHLTQADPDRNDAARSPGTVVSANPAEGLWIQTGQGQLRILRLQLAGGNALSAEEFLRGHPISPGVQLRPLPRPKSP